MPHIIFLMTFSIISHAQKNVVQPLQPIHTHTCWPFGENGVITCVDEIHNVFNCDMVIVYTYVNFVNTHSKSNANRAA